MEGVYIVKSISNFFLLTVKADEDGEYTIALIATPSKNEPRRFGVDCVQIMTFKPEDNRHEDYHLAQLHYDSTCALGGGLGHGIGTEEMLMCTLGFCYKLFTREEDNSKPMVFDLLDASEIYCDGHKVSLRDFELLVKGKTWYQRKFGATTTDPDEQTHLDELREKLTNTRFELWNFESIRQKISQRLGASLKDKYVQIMQESLDRNESWQELIQRVADAQGCSFFFDDVTSYIKNTLGIHTVNEFNLEMTRARADLYVVDQHLVYPS